MIWFLANWRLVLFGSIFAAFLAASGLAWFRGAQVGELEQSLSEAQKQADLAIATYEAYKADTDKMVLILTDEKDRALSREKVARKREREILNVPADQDGAVAPVLRGSLERLRNQ